MVPLEHDELLNEAPDSQEEDWDASERGEGTFQSRVQENETYRRVIAKTIVETTAAMLLIPKSARVLANERGAMIGGFAVAAAPSAGARFAAPTKLTDLSSEAGASRQG